MKNLWIGALVLAMAPAIANAGGGRYYDRGDRYVGRSSSSFGFSFGFGSGGYHGGDFSYANVRYSTGRPYYGGYGNSYRNYDCGPRVYSRSYYAPRYCPPAVYAAPVYVAPPPVVYYPSRTYYYNDYGPSCYSPRGAYYSGYSGRSYYYGR